MQESCPPIILQVSGQESEPAGGPSAGAAGSGIAAVTLQGSGKNGGAWERRARTAKNLGVEARRAESSLPECPELANEAGGAQEAGRN